MDVVEPPMVLRVREDAAGASLRHRIEYAGLRLALLVARRLSTERLASIGAFVMRLVGPRLRQNRRALANLAVAFPSMPIAERAAIAREMWANMGRTFAEMLVLDRLIVDSTSVLVADEDVWAARTAEPGPIVGCSLHMGNWELVTLPLVRFGRKPAGVYKPVDNPLIDAWLRETRSAIYPAGLLGKGDRDDTSGTGQRTARQLIDRARSGGTIGFVVDHFDRRGELVPFMGRQGRFATAPAMIARHVGARLWIARCVRIGASSRFRVDARDVAIPRTGDKKADSAALMAEIFAIFEEWIRENPEQWMWWNTRWVEPRSDCPPARP
jgi:KDO2-lipid IV(A) lauroyltransferase